MKNIHRLVCPGCGMETLTECEYVTCPCCHRSYYASESAHLRPRPAIKTETFVNGTPLSEWLKQNGSGS
jgi:hypothetical protein